MAAIERTTGGGGGQAVSASDATRADAPGAPGTVYLVGAGPGDPGLLTRRGAHLLGRAGVVVYDALLDPRVLELAPSTAERIYVGKRAGVPGTSQERIHRILVDAAHRTRVVVRLKGGDPLVFGRGGEEALALVAAGVPHEVVPGVTAALGAAAAAGIPLTHRGVASAVTFATGTVEGGGSAWEAPRRAETLVLYMAVRRLPALVRRLLGEGWPEATPAAVVERATWLEERVLRAPLARLPARAREVGVESPALVIVGDVVAVGDGIAAGRAAPLQDLRAVVARARAHPSLVVEALGRAGARARGFPRFERAPAPSRHRLLTAVREVGSRDAVLFTSPSAVDATLEALGEIGRDARALAGVRVLCFGTATTTAARRHGIRPDAAASTYDTGAAIRVVEEGWALTGRRILHPTRPRIPSPIAAALRGAGARVDSVLAYDQMAPEPDCEALREALRAGRVDALVFPSSSAVASYVRAMGGAAYGKARVVAIGKSTARTLRAAGLPVDISPARPSVDALIEELEAHVHQPRLQDRSDRDREPPEPGAPPRRPRLAVGC